MLYKSSMFLGREKPSHTLHMLTCKPIRSLLDPASHATQPEQKRRRALLLEGPRETACKHENIGTDTRHAAAKPKRISRIGLFEGAIFHSWILDALDTRYDRLSLDVSCATVTGLPAHQGTNCRSKQIHTQLEHRNSRKLRRAPNAGRHCNSQLLLLYSAVCKHFQAPAFSSLWGC